MTSLKDLVNRRMTSMTLQKVGVPITLRRRVWVDTPAGGQAASDPAPLSTAQQFDLVPVEGSLKNLVVSNADGQQEKTWYAMIGKLDADVERLDTFSLRGLDFEVHTILRDAEQQQTVCGVVEVGPSGG